MNRKWSKHLVPSVASGSDPYGSQQLLRLFEKKNYHPKLRLNEEGEPLKPIAAITSSIFI